MLRKTKIFAVALTLTMALLISFELKAQSVRTVKTYYDVYNVHIKAIEQATDDNKLHGVQKYYFEDGALLALYNYKFNLMDGVQKTFFHNGQPQTAYIYSLGKFNGEQLEYQYQDAKYCLLHNAFYNKGILIRLTDYYPSGKKASHYERNGACTNWDENGLIIEEHINVDDLMQGEAKLWRDGKLIASGHYLNDSMEGLWQYYDTDGQLIGYEGYLKGKDTGEARIYLNEHMLPIQSKAEARYLRAIDYRTSPPGYKTVHHARDFYYSGEKYWDGYLMDISNASPLLTRKFLQVSHSRFLYKNGKVQSEGDYLIQSNVEQPSKTGDWKYYTESGDLDYVENYSSNGQLISTKKKEDLK